MSPSRSTSQSSTILAHLATARSRPLKLFAIRYKERDKWVEVSWPQFYQKIELTTLGLKSLGVKSGDRVAIMSNTRFEWACMDYAIMALGAVTVPIYQNQRAEEFKYILQEAKPKVVVIENKAQWALWRQIAKTCEFVDSVILFDGTDLAEVEGRPDTQTFADLLKLGKGLTGTHSTFFEETLRQPSLDQVATILYTSGTTGEPKGVVLTHRQIMSEAEDVLRVIPLDQSDSSLCFLPFAHVLGRLEMWGSLIAGYTLNFAESIDRLRANLLELHPTFLISVPRVFEKIYGGINAQVDANPISQKLFHWALDLGRQVSRLHQDQNPIPLSLAVSYKVAQTTILKEIRRQLGGRLRFAISGGAPLSQDIAEFFHAADILILEGYGLTETTAAVTTNSPLNYKFGTVGRPLADVKIKIAEDGEILVQSQKVMREYYNRPEETEKVLVDGYFATGDVGFVDDDGFLKITDRKKDLIKTAGGKYVAPQKLENLLKQSPYIGNVLIHGDMEKYIVALLTLNQDAIKSYAKKKEISFQDFSTLSQHPQIRGLIRGIVAETNNQLSSFECIKNFAVLPHDFTIDSGELTPSLKVKRKFCSEKYLSEIQSLYD